MFVDFIRACFDRLYDQATKFCFMFGGRAVTPA